jgi:hypothetical protein
MDQAPPDPQAPAPTAPGSGPGATSRRSFRYPTGFLLAVIDDPALAAGAARAVVAAGVPAEHVETISGDGAEDRMDLLAADSLITRFMSGLRFVTMDQQPDFALYMAALRDGRSIVAVKVRDRAVQDRIVARLTGAGAHFLNYYGRVATEEITRWRGPELPLPGWLRR